MRSGRGRPGRAWLHLLVGLIVGLPGLLAAQPAAKGLAFGPVPAWVQPQAVPLAAAAPAEGLSQGRHYLLADEQVRVAGATLTGYHHVATRAVNERGVEDIANVQIRFDPAYQRLTIHRIEVLRAGKPVFRVAPGSVKLLQREASLESLIYDGRLTAHVALQDVRVGDVVQTVYSVQGFNPAFGAHRFGSFDFDWGMPVAYRHARLLWSAGRPLHWKLHNGARPARVTQAGGELDHRWQLRDVPARIVDNDSPGWYDPYAWVEWGEFADWAGVVRWALPLYEVPAGAQPAVDREVARIAAETSEPEQRLLAALRFVQREVRYLGIEMGVNSHEPHPPEQVLQRRYGDCKDKTLLSLALLRGLGIPARAALVSTRLRHTTADRLPTPWAFNHVLVQADLGERRVWLDPTRRPQGGENVAQWVQADFGRALLGAMAVPDLQELLRSPKGLNRVSPLSLRHPVDFRLVSEFRLPGTWSMQPDKLVVDDPAFTLRREESWKGSTLTLSDHYRSRSDHVVAADMPRYVTALEKARVGVSQDLYRVDDGAAEPGASVGAEGPHWVPACVLLGTLGLLAWGVRRLHRWDPCPEPLPPGAVAETSIGGWLWLPLIGLGVSALLTVSTLLEAAPGMTVQGWSVLTQPGSPAYHPLWAPLILMELVSYPAIVAGALFVAWLMLKRRSSTPQLYLAWMALVVLTTLVEAALCQLIPALREDWTGKDQAQVIRTCVHAAIWCTYMLRSARVRRTFQQRLVVPAADHPQSPQAVSSA